jgi:hypothetical protein
MCDSYTLKKMLRCTENGILGAKDGDVLDHIDPSDFAPLIAKHWTKQLAHNPNDDGMGLCATMIESLRTRNPEFKAKFDKHMELFKNSVTSTSNTEKSVESCVTKDPPPPPPPPPSSVDNTTTTCELHCATCDATSTNILQCSGCNKVYYCNRTCQRANWKQHKLVCKKS